MHHGAKSPTVGLAHRAAHNLRSGSRSVPSGATDPVIEAIPAKTGGRDAALSSATTGELADQEDAPASPNRWHSLRAIEVMTGLASRLRVG